MSRTAKTHGRAVILATQTIISPFGDSAAECLFTDQTIAQWQDSACKTAKLEVTRANTVLEAIELISTAPTGPMVMFLDRHYISEKALVDFIKVAEKQSEQEKFQLALEINASVEYTLPLQSVARCGDNVLHDVFYLGDRGNLPTAGEEIESWLCELRQQSTALTIPKREIVIDVPLPTIGEQARSVMRYPISSTIVVSIEHWTHVLWLNQLAFGIRWVELLRRHPFWGVWRAATALSLKPDNILRRLVWRGRKCKIHRTAHVSGSIIGDGAVIGPHATIRNSFIAAGAHIQDHAVILNSVVGENTMIIENSFLVSCMSYPDATVGNYKLQVSLIGRGAYINSWAGFIDAKFVGHVRVKHRGEIVSTERSFLGSVIGHRAKVAAKILIHPGREIPNDTIVVMRPDEVVSVVPDNIPPNTPMVRDGGTLVPLGQERRSS